MLSKLLLALALPWLFAALPGVARAQAGPSRCSVGSKAGVCISTTSCSAAKGKSEPTHCQGAADIQCCYNIPCAGAGSLCNWNDSCTGKSTPQLCPGPANFQCCEATSGSPAPTLAPCGSRPCGESSTPNPTPTYVALGDSFAAGLGSADTYDDNAKCKRSAVAYPKLVGNRLGANLNFKACSGGKIPDVLNQLSQLTDGQWLGVDYVTLSVGGNDIGFQPALRDCGLHETTCNLTKVAYDIDNTLGGRLVDLYKKVKTRAANAVVVVTGYPRLFSDKVCNVGVSYTPSQLQSHFSVEELRSANVLADKLAATIKNAVANSGGGIRFVDPRNAFVGHAICTDDPWINNISLQCPNGGQLGFSSNLLNCVEDLPEASDESMHPTSKGQEVYANIVYACLTGGACV